MKDYDKSFVTTQVVAEIHHYQLTEPTNIKDLINLENHCIKKLEEITLLEDESQSSRADDPDLSPDLIVESSELISEKCEDDGSSSSVDEIEEDCSDLTSYRTDSYSSGESSDARSPAPGPLSPSRRRSVSLTNSCCRINESGVGCGEGVEGPKMCTATLTGHSTASNYVRYDKPSQVPYTRNPKTAGLNFNTNLRKPPENWLRMRSASQGSGHNGWGRHGAPYWSYPYSKSSSWSMFAFRYVGRGRRPFHKGLANNIVCLCCGCCNCSRVNQTLCCCCYHCVHRISSCRRPDLTKHVRQGPLIGPRKSVSNSLQQPACEGDPNGGAEASGSGTCGQAHEPESGLESGMDSGTESTSGKTSEKSKKKSSSGSGKSSTTTPSNETMPKSYKLSTLF
ncbi:uncharacterized protein LOC107368548 [Tetranychus urticae]|uniref:Uncharacterized protein n=1 Tax=Tetranychus urticae TaxID=32264 RepID=T1KYT0_TETUR|nr:uncharacterized protein LOC107368548 [Tetranychus urticae]XP_025017934.1 uncharacterized protein LOC107368548 [Tetranychus urticae]